MFLCEEHLGCSGKNIRPYSADKKLKFEICDECGLIWRSKDSLHLCKTYEEDYFTSKKYDKKRNHKVKKSGWLIDISRTYNPNISSLLEIGCSIGYTLEAAKIRGIDELGTDISKYAVEYCEKLDLNAAQTTFENLIDSNQKFDLIFMQHVLEHFEDPFATLGKCSELLNENGLILIMVPNSNYKRAISKNSKHRFYSMSGVGPEHYVYFNYNNIESVLNAKGFKVEQKNYPIFMKKYESFQFLMNRLFRRLLSLIQSDQEILVVARKKSN